ncbi:hypothetical protein [Alteribacillus bidgolensis]|uniref:NADPH-dependent FMN reductase n=1 Tax=Alteribacillus bidgolensis TaxID=930129 RepID=A0A1G8QQP9_9BACI|nr:hypothetical protein [Alteribacillus bidgolensis]SDJ06988.1 hypothetical protein SAMN05216352_12138 [Alteribacillus bidgolensis]
MLSIDVGEGGEWPHIFEKIKKAEVLLIGTPVWLGERSSIATKVIKRIYAASSFTNEKGQFLYYNNIGGTVVTGNEVHPI